MGKIIIVLLLLVILGLYFFTDQTKAGLKKLTGFVVDKGKDVIIDTVNESVKNFNATEIKDTIIKEVKQNT